jgi:hypothetical protein
LSPTYQASTDYKIKVFASDVDGRTFDVAFKHFSELGDSERARLEHGSTAWDLGSVVQGTIHEHSFTLANVGLANAWVWASEGAPLPLRSEATLFQLVPGEQGRVDLLVDLSQFPASPFTETVTVRTSDPDNQSIVLKVTGVVQAPTDEAIAYPLDAYHPWDEYVYIPGPHSANDIIRYTPAVSLPEGTQPLYLADKQGNILGQGRSVAGMAIPQGVLAPPEAEAQSCQATTPDDTAATLPGNGNTLAADTTSKEIALAPDIWMAATADWEVMHQGNVIVRRPPAWHMEELVLTEGGAGFQVANGEASIKVLVQAREPQSPGAEHPQIATYRLAGYEVSDVMVKGIPSWQVVPAIPDANLCREVMVATEESWVRFQLQATAQDRDCQAKHEFELMVASLQMLVGSATEAETSGEMLAQAFSLPSAGQDLLAEPRTGTCYNHGAGSGYASQYCGCQCNGGCDGIYYSGGDGGHFIAHSLCNGGFPIHCCAGQGHDDARVVNIASQRSYIHGFENVYGVSPGSLQIGDVVYIGQGSCWGWGGMVTGMSGGLPYISTHSSETCNGRYDYYYSYCGTAATYDFVHIDSTRPGKPTLNNIANADMNGSYTVSWSSVSKAIRYELQEKRCGGSWSTIHNGSATQKSRTGRSPGVWYYRVRACNECGCGDWSATKSAKVKPGKPTLYDISNPDGDGSFTVDWSGVSGADSYTLQQQYEGGSWSAVYTGSSSQKAITGRSSGTWCYRVLASACGVNGDQSAIKCTSVNVGPNSPVNLTPADGAGHLGRQLTLGWEDGGDPDNAPNPYREFRAELWVPAGDWLDNLDWTQHLTWTTTVPDDGDYLWHVEATDGGETSGWTAEHQLQVFSLDRADPDQVAVALPEPVDSHARYRIQYGAHAAFSSTPETHVVEVTVPKATYSDVVLDLFLAAALSSTVAFGLDVGYDGQDDWQESIIWTSPTVVHAPDLSSAFNTYLASRPEAPGTLLTVPLAVSQNVEGVLFLANLSFVPQRNADAALTPSGISFSQLSPTEGDKVTIQAVISNTEGTAIENMIAAFYVGDPDSGGTYLGADLVSNLLAGSTAVASLDWDTQGYVGNLDLCVVLDPAEQVAETDESNNMACRSIAVLTRPDLRIAALAYSDLEPVAGESVAVSVTVSNDGQSVAGSTTCTLYEGSPQEGGTLVGEQSAPSLPSEAQETLTFDWAPAAPGPHMLYVLTDVGDVVSESDETNNSATREVYVGFAGPILLDSGSENEPLYLAALGYGAIDEGQPDMISVCGAGLYPQDTLRHDPDGRVVYRFDHLLPGHFYHLDVTLNECDGAGRQESVYVDGQLVAGPEDLGDGALHRLSLLLDPALYADQTITISVEAPGIDGAVVSEVNLYDVDYRYADAGGTPDPPFPNPYAYGWLDGSANTGWGTLPDQSVRVDGSDNELRYRFTGLAAAKRYRMHLTFWQPSGTARIQQVWIDDLDTGLAVNSGDYQLHRETLNVPLTAYATDSSIDLRIIRTNAPTGAMINEVALEEVTVNEGGRLDLLAGLQGRSDHSGALFSAWTGGQATGSCTSSSGGACSMMLPTGVYSVTVEMASYLDSVWDSVSLGNSGTELLPSVQLRGGDVNDDCTINILDLSRMGSRFAGQCGDPGWDVTSDINADCALNVMDLSMAGGNFDRSCPVPWEDAQRAEAATLGTAQVKLQPSDLGLTPGDTGTVTIAVAGAAGLYGMEVHLTFDPSVVEVVDADAQKSGIQVALGDLLSPDFVATNMVSNTAGTIDVALTQLAPVPPSDGEGALAAITFRAVGIGASSLDFVSVILADAEGTRMPAEVQNGRIKVGGQEHKIYLPLVTNSGSP